MALALDVIKPGSRHTFYGEQTEMLPKLVE
jgi:hypothetical protein